MIFENGFKKLTIPIFIFLLIFVSFIIIKPIVLPIISGFILAYICLPIHNKISKYIKNKNFSVTIVLFIILALIGFSLWFLIPVIITQSFEIYLALQKVDFLEIAKRILPATLDQNMVREIVLNFNKMVSTLASTFFSSLTNVLLNLHLIFLKITVTLIVFFFSLRDYEKIKDSLNKISPFSEKINKSLSQNLYEVTNAVIYGTIIVGIIQGLLTGLGLFIFGVPQVIFLTIIAVIAAIVPIVGAWLVWIPASLGLIASGNVTMGIGLAIYGATFISWIDNIIRPYFVSKRTNLSTALIFIGMLGGLVSFGLIGLILGPIILSYLSVVLETYFEYSKKRIKKVL